MMKNLKNALFFGIFFLVLVGLLLSACGQSSSNNSGRRPNPVVLQDLQFSSQKIETAKSVPEISSAVSSKEIETPFILVATPTPLATSMVQGSPTAEPTLTLIPIQTATVEVSQVITCSNNDPQLLQFVEGADAMISVPVADIWENATDSGEWNLLTQFLLARPIRVLEEGVNRSRVQGSDYQGWVDNREFVKVDPDQLLSFRKRCFALMASKNAELVLDSGTSLQIYAGTTLPLIDEDENFYQVEIPNMGIGKVSKADMKFMGKEFKHTFEELYQQAQKYLGVSYKWGGTSPQGFDCSGFVQTVVRNTWGVFLPRDSQEQLDYLTQKGAEISFREIAPGDLVFFSSKGLRMKVDHMAIYLGEDQVIDAAFSSGKVMIRRLDLVGLELVAAARIVDCKDGCVGISDNQVIEKLTSPVPLGYQPWIERELNGRSWGYRPDHWGVDLTVEKDLPGPIPLVVTIDKAKLLFKGFIPIGGGASAIFTFPDGTGADFTAQQLDGTGNVAIIGNENEVRIYAHGADLPAQEIGSEVKLGEVLMHMGETGLVSGDGICTNRRHLHYARMIKTDQGWIFANPEETLPIKELKWKCW